MAKSHYPVHRYFNKFGKSQTKCSFCGWLTFSNATRMLKHLKSCVKCPEEIKKIVIKTTASHSQSKSQKELATNPKNGPFLDDPG